MINQCWSDDNNDDSSMNVSTNNKNNNKTPTWQHLAQRMKEACEFQPNRFDGRAVIGEANDSCDVINAPQDSIGADLVETKLTDDVQHKMIQKRKIK